MDHDPLLRSLRVAVEASPDDTVLRLHLARMLDHAGYRAESLRHVAGVLQRDPLCEEALDLIHWTADQLPEPRPPRPGPIPHPSPAPDPSLPPPPGPQPPTPRPPADHPAMEPLPWHLIEPDDSAPDAEDDARPSELSWIPVRRDLLD